MSADAAPAEMPGEEEIARALHDDLYPPEEARSPADQEKHWLSTEAHYREQAQVVLALFAPILAEKDAQVRAGEIMTQKMRELAARQKAAGKEYYDRALAAEAALAAERERADCAVRQMIKQNERLAVIRAQG